MKSDGKSQNGSSGMSRAAKKRAKKNKKRNQESAKDLAAAAQGTLEEEKQSHKKIKLQEKEEEKGKQSRIFNNPKGDDNDNALEMKTTATSAKQDKSEDDDDDGPLIKSENSEPPSLPADTSLVEILLLKESKSEESKAVLEDMSARERAECLFQTIIDPIPLDEFYAEYWEKKPLLVPAKSNNKKRYEGLLSLKGIKEMSRTSTLHYAQDLNVTRYQKDKDGIKRRITLDKVSDEDGPTGSIVDAKGLWKNYNNGCTIRLLCPHKHSDSVHALLSTLELELQCMVGANAYLTPPKGSQGFAPHYDDIEAICLQLEGSKRWKVYPPKFKLPRSSSEDYTPKDLEGIEPVIDTVLHEGDLLYMPRGWIHQACTIPGDDNEHSLHLTVSAMQQWAWVDLLETVMPDALEAAAMSETSTSLRQGLPRGFMDYMGLMYEEPSEDKLPDSLKKIANVDSDESLKYRKMLQENFRAEAKKKILKVAKAAHGMIDAACDQMAKRFMSERQPPSLTKSEIEATARRGNIGSNEQEEEDDDGEKPILPNTLCRLVRPGIARLVIEDSKAIVYHCTDNSREFQGNPISPMEYEMDDGPAIEQLFTTVEPHWIFVNDLYHDTIEDKIAIVQSLYDEGILAVRHTEQE